VNRELSRRILALSLRGKIALVWRIFRDRDVPMLPKAILPVVVAYLMFPFDVMPDDIPLAGQLDDLLVIAGGLTLFLLLTPRNVVEFHLGQLE